MSKKVDNCLYCKKCENLGNGDYICTKYYKIVIRQYSDVTEYYLKCKENPNEKQK